MINITLRFLFFFLVLVQINRPLSAQENSDADYTLIDKRKGVIVSLEQGVKAQNILIGMSTLYYRANNWSQYSAWGIGLSSNQEVDIEYQNANLFRLGIGMGLMKNISLNSVIFQKHELQILPGYESWKSLSTNKNEGNWTIGGYFSPQIALMLSESLLIGAGPFGEYHFNSELSPYEYGGKVEGQIFF